MLLRALGSDPGVDARWRCLVLEQEGVLAGRVALLGCHAGITCLGLNIGGLAEEVLQGKQGQ